MFLLAVVLVVGVFIFAQLKIAEPPQSVQFPSPDTPLEPVPNDL